MGSEFAAVLRTSQCACSVTLLQLNRSGPHSCCQLSTRRFVLAFICAEEEDARSVVLHRLAYEAGKRVYRRRVDGPSLKKPCFYNWIMRNCYRRRARDYRRIKMN